MKKYNIAILTGQNSGLITKILYKLYFSKDFQVVKIIQESKRRTNILNRLKLKGIRYSFYVLIKTLLLKFIYKYFKSDFYDLDSALKYCKLEKHVVSDHNSLDTQTLLENDDIDIIVLVGCRIIKPNILNIPNISTVNIHGHDIEKIRGSGYPGFWELIEGYNEFGITIHKVVKELDEGAIIYRKTYPLMGSDLSVFESIYQIEAPICLMKGLEILISDNKTKKQDLTAGKYKKTPNKHDFELFLKKVGHEAY